MAAEPGPEFRWGLVLRRSRYSKRKNDKGEVELFEESTRRQEIALTNNVKHNNMGRIVAVYKDVGSAYREGVKRPGYEAGLLDLSAGRIDGLAVWRIDRLVRRSAQYRHLLDVLEESGGRLYSMTENIDTAAEGTSKAITNIILSILAHLAEMEAEATSARINLMHEDCARMGLVHRSSRRPFGHSEDWMALVPAEVKLIEEAAGRVIAGKGAKTIIKDWTERGIKTTAGNSWDPSAFRRMLMSARLIGKREYGRALFDMAGVPPILDEETWRQVQEVFNGHQRRPGRKATRLATNIATCSLCESPIVGNSESNGRLSYVCRRNKARPDACGGICADGKGVDDAIAEQVCRFLNDRARVAKLLRQHAQGAELDALHARQEELNESLVALDDALNPPPGKPRMSLPRYWAQVEKIEAERAVLQRKLAVTREAALLTETMNVEWSPEVWNEQPLEWRRAILKLVTLSIALCKPIARTHPGVYGVKFDPSRVKIEFAVEALR